MATVAFPASLSGLLERGSVFSVRSISKLDTTADGSPRVRLLGQSEYTGIRCRFRVLSDTEKDTLVTFLRDNATNTVTWTIDGDDYEGYIDGGHSVAMVGNRFNVSFQYYAKIV